MRSEGGEGLLCIANEGRSEDRAGKAKVTDQGKEA